MTAKFIQHNIKKSLSPSMNFPFFNFSKALTREIDPSIVDYGLRKEEGSSKISIDLAQNQHENLINILRDYMNIPIFILESNGYPDSVFVEDTSVAVGNTALITNPGAPSRRGETQAVKDFFKTNLKDIDLCEIPNQILQAEHQRDVPILDGGDVLFTGREFFIGITKRTNLSGIAALASFFPSYRVTAIPFTPSHFNPLHHRDANPTHQSDVNSVTFSVGTAPLHLKSACSMAFHDHVLTGGLFGCFIQAAIETCSPGTYSFSHVSQEFASNCVFGNGVLVTRGFGEMQQETAGVLDRLVRDLKVKGLRDHVEVEAGELAKVDGALTCCSVLLS